MEALQIYECLCDLSRLRLLNLLRSGEVCVCHLHEALSLPQAQVSKHLAYLRARGAVEARSAGRWKYYRLPSKPSPFLARQLSCLEEIFAAEPSFQGDRAKLRDLLGTTALPPDCCS